MNLKNDHHSSKLISDFKDSFEGKPWYGDSVIKKLSVINSEIVNLQPLSSFNSIAKIVHHMINWRVFAIKKMQGDEAFDIQQNDKNDWTEVHISSREDWDRLIKKLKASQEQIIMLLSAKGEGFLGEKVLGRGYDFGFLLAGIVQHDIYHLSQIALVKKWSENQNESSKTLV